MKPQIVVRDGDGKVIDPATFRPTAHSPTLNAYVDAMVGASDRYPAAVDRSERAVVYTAAGRTDMKQGHAKPALAAVSTAFRQAKQQAVGELIIASDRFDAALRNRLPPADVVRVAIGAQLRADDRLRALLVHKVESDTVDITFEDIERIEAGAVLPLSLTGITAEQRAAWKAYCVPAETTALKRALEASQYVDELVASLVSRIATDASLPFPEVAGIVGDSVVEAMRQQDVSSRRRDVPNIENYRAVSSAEPLVSGDKVNDGFSAEAVA